MVVKSTRITKTRITLAENSQGGLNSDVRVPRQFLKESLWLIHDIIRGRVILAVNC